MPASSIRSSERGYYKLILAEIAADPLPMDLAKELFGVDPAGDPICQRAVECRYTSRDYFTMCLSSLCRLNPDLFFLVRRGLTDPNIKLTSPQHETLESMGFLCKVEGGELRIHPMALELLCEVDFNNFDARWKPNKTTYTAEEEELAPLAALTKKKDELETPFANLLEKGLRHALHESPEFVRYYLKSASIFAPHIYEAFKQFSENRYSAWARGLLRELGVLKDNFDSLPLSVELYISTGDIPGLEQFPECSFLCPEDSSHPGSAQHLTLMSEEFADTQSTNEIKKLEQAVIFLKTVKVENREELAAIILKNRVQDLPYVDFIKLLQLHLIEPSAGEDIFEEYQFSSVMKEALLVEKWTEEKILPEPEDLTVLPEPAIDGVRNEAKGTESCSEEDQINEAPAEIKQEKKPRNRQPTTSKASRQKPRRDEHLIKFIKKGVGAERQWRKEDLINIALSSLLNYCPNAFTDLSITLSEVLPSGLHQDLLDLRIIEDGKFTLIARIWAEANGHALKQIDPEIEDSADDKVTWKLPKALLTGNIDSNPKGRVFEFCQANKIQSPMIDCSFEGEPHSPIFKATVSIDLGGATLTGSVDELARTKKEAEQIAFSHLLQAIVELSQHNSGDEKSKTKE